MHASKKINNINWSKNIENYVREKGLSTKTLVLTYFSIFVF